LSESVPEIPQLAEAKIQLKVISRVGARFLAPTSIFSGEFRKWEEGEIMNTLELKVNNARSVCVMDKEGWSAIVHGNYQYMK
jgi:hypothetical protein